MLIKRKSEQNKLIKHIQEKIELNQKINISELEKLLELNYEIVFEYNGDKYEIIQNRNYIELHNNCFYVDNKTNSLFYAKFTNPKEFIENAKICDKKIAQIINEIKIISF